MVGTTNNTVPLGMEIWIDDQQIFNLSWIKDSYKISHNISDLDAEHELRFVMKNKTADHTKVDETGAIVDDACLTISDLTFDDIALGYILTEKAVYTHNFNSNSEVTQDKFFGQMGCNGTVSMKFTAPVYLWLLENL